MSAGFLREQLDVNLIVFLCSGSVILESDKKKSFNTTLSHFGQCTGLDRGADSVRA